MIAYRAESAMALAVAPEMDSPDTARSLLKALFRSDASLRPDPAAGPLTVRPLHLATRAQDKALRLRHTVSFQLTGVSSLWPSSMCQCDGPDPKRSGMRDGIASERT